MNNLMRRSLMTAGSPSAAGGIQTGEFNMISASSGNQQISTADWSVEIQAVAGEYVAGAAFFAGEGGWHNNSAQLVFAGSGQSNSYHSGAGGVQENVPFTSASAQYMRYDPETGVIRLHVKQWAQIRTGRWVWVLVPAKEA